MKLKLKKCTILAPRLLAVTLFITSFTAAPAHAYLCWHDQSPLQTKDNADYVFLGKVIGLSNWGKTSSELNSTRQRITFETSSVWKGLTEEDTVVEADTEALYQYKFKKDESYLVYGYKLYANRVSLVGCPRVEDENTAARAVRQLGEPIFIAGAPEPDVTVEVSISDDDLNDAETLLDDTAPEEIISEEVVENIPADTKEPTPKADLNIPGFEIVEFDDIEAPVKTADDKTAPQAKPADATPKPETNPETIKADDFDIEIDEEVDDMALEFDADIDTSEEEVDIEFDEDEDAVFDLKTLSKDEAPKLAERLSGMTLAAREELARNPKEDILYLINTPDAEWVQIRRGFETAAKNSK
jgi:hypothetical protein